MNNLPRQKLCEILKIYGKDTCNNHKRIRGLLNDFCSGNYPEINFLLMALEEHVYTELITSSKTVPYEMVSARLIKRLYTNRGMVEEIARWTVNSWALALEVILDETPYTTPQISSNAPRQNRAQVVTNSANTIVQQTIIVSLTGGQYTSISAALESAMPDTIILIKPGHYEGFTINKRVEIKGDGPREQIIIESKDTSCIRMRTDDEALVQGLTLRCTGTVTNTQKPAVELSRGRLKLIGCDITSDISPCVIISGPSTNPKIQGCWLHDAQEGSGLLIEKHAQGTIEDCSIFGNSYPNISIKPYTNLVVKRCKIYNGRNHGILIWENASGTVEDCDIFRNASAGVEIKDTATPSIRLCHIYENVRQGEWVYNNNMGNTSQQRDYRETHRTTTFGKVKYTPENTSHQQKVTHQPEKKPNRIDLFLRSIHLSRKK